MLSVILSSCNSDLDVQEIYSFDLVTMPITK